MGTASVLCTVVDDVESSHVLEICVGSIWRIHYANARDGTLAGYRWRGGETNKSSHGQCISDAQSDSAGSSRIWLRREEER